MPDGLEQMSAQMSASALYHLCRLFGSVSTIPFEALSLPISREAPGAGRQTRCVEYVAGAVNVIGDEVKDAIEDGIVAIIEFFGGLF